MPTIRILLTRTHQLLDNQYQDALHAAGAGVTPSQATVLLAVSGLEEPSQSDLVKDTGIDRSTMADVVKRLVKKGLIERKRNKEDARAYVLKLTHKGKEIAIRAGVADETLHKRIARSAKGLEDALSELVGRGEKPRLVAAE